MAVVHAFFAKASATLQPIWGQCAAQTTVTAVHGSTRPSTLRGTV